MSSALFATRQSWPAAPESALPAVGRFSARESEVVLVRRAQAGDGQAAEELIRGHLRLIYRVARRYRCRSLSVDDLAQEGVLGLILAIHRFDPSRGCRLCTYALHWVRQAIARAVEQHDRLIHLPVQAAADIRTIHRLQEEAQLHEGSYLDPSLIAQATGLAEGRVCDLLSATQDAVSLDSVGADGDGSVWDAFEDESAVNPEQDVIRGFYRTQLRSLVGELCPRERMIVEARFGLAGHAPRTLDDISRELRVSRERVRQIEVRAITKLRRALRAQALD